MRLDIERQNTLEPKRLEFAKKEIESLGYTITFQSETELQFIFMDIKYIIFHIQVGIPEVQLKMGKV
jgi:alpha-galactosidase/6-phospho-beta-glucosidase family protein